MPGLTLEDKVTKHREEFIDLRARVEEGAKRLEDKVDAQGKSFDGKLETLEKNFNGKMETLEDGLGGLRTDVQTLTATVQTHLTRRNGNGNGSRLHAIMHNPVARGTAMTGGGAGIGAFVLWLAQRLSE